MRHFFLTTMLTFFSYNAIADCNALSDYMGNYELTSSTCGHKFGDSFIIDRFVSSNGEFVYRLINPAIAIIGNRMCEVTESRLVVNAGENLKLDLSNQLLAVTWDQCQATFSKLP